MLVFLYVKSSTDLWLNVFLDSVVVTTFDGAGSKQANNTSYLVKNMNLGSGLKHNKDGCYLTSAGMTSNHSIMR